MDHMYVTPSSDKRKGKALFRCIIGGWFGWHYFYVGRVGRGLLCIPTLNFFCIGWLIDTITIMNGRFRDNTGMFLRH